MAQIKATSKQNDMATIVALMKSNMSAPEVQQEVCRIMESLTRNSDVNRVSIAKALSPL